jgi:hypothetical protein
MPLAEVVVFPGNYRAGIPGISGVSGYNDCSKNACKRKRRPNLIRHLDLAWHDMYMSTPQGSQGYKNFLHCVKWRPSEMESDLIFFQHLQVLTYTLLLNVSANP